MADQLHGVNKRANLFAAQAYAIVPADAAHSNRYADQMTGGPPLHQSSDTLHPVQALAISLLMPWQACRQAWRETGIGLSLVYHAAGLVLFFVGMFLIDAAFWYGDMTYGMFDPAVLLGLAIWLIVIELIYLFFALCTCCWGADHESFSESFSRSLSRWYQLTVFHAGWTLGFTIAMHIVREMSYSGFGNDYGTFSYQLSEFVYSMLYLATFVVYLGVGGWFTLRTLAVPRNASAYLPKCRWPALCEGCGYALVGMTDEQTCPECGKSVRESRYTPRGNISHKTLATMWLALINPAAIGQTITTRDRSKQAAKALAITALTLFFTGPIGMSLMAVAVRVYNGQLYFGSAFELIQIYIIGGLGTGLSAAILGVFSVLAVGSLVGLFNRVLGKRNVMPQACQGACLASGYVLFHAALMYGFTAVLVLVAEHQLGHIGFGLIAIIPLAWLTVATLLSLPLCFIVGRIVRGSRYANV